jgi:NTE family protein
MNFQLRPYLPTEGRLLPFECVSLLLQGGGALGAYQGGVYEALAEADIHPNWIVGISIGAINAAIIAGNPPNVRVDRLREFWTQVTSHGPWDWSRNSLLELSRSDETRNLLNQMNATWLPRSGQRAFSPPGLWSLQGQLPRHLAEVVTRQISRKAMICKS